MIFIFIVDGARAVISFCIRSAIPGYIVVPPESTVLAYRSFLISTPHFIIPFPRKMVGRVLLGIGTFHSQL